MDVGIGYHRRHNTASDCNRLMNKSFVNVFDSSLANVCVCVYVYVRVYLCGLRISAEAK